MATNMAGRGVDIVLGGDVQRENYKTEKEYEKAKKEWEKEHEEVLQLGGLFVIGTERHESRRIDNQLRGRSGRQGDAGETQFFVSLEDDVMRIFGGEQISKLMDFLKFPEDQPLSHGMVTRAIEQAQVKVEGFNFDIRKHLVEYDDVLNKQREILYALRKKMLLLPEENPKEFKETFFEMITEHVTSMSASFFALRETDETFQTQFENDIELLLDIDTNKIRKLLQNQDQEGFMKLILKEAENKFKSKEKEVGEEMWYQVVRSLFLTTFDQFWTQHLTAIEDLREGINLRGYAQMDPLVEYKNEAFGMFERLLSSVQYESIRRVMRVQMAPQELQQLEKPKEDKKPMQLKAASAINPFTKEVEKNPEQSESEKLDMTPTSKPKLGRNDPCWCGSGKKYKKCHYPN